MERVPMNPFKSREAGKKSTENAEKEQLILSNDYKHLFNDTPAGRRVFRDLLEFCGVFEVNSHINSQVFVENGKKMVGLHILHLREFGIETELKLMREETYQPKKGEEK